MIIRSRLARAGAALTAVAAAWVVAYVWWKDGFHDGLTAAGWALLLLVVVWAMWWAPDVVLREQGLLVRNTWLQHEVDWRQLEQCRTRWFLEIVLKDGGVVRAAAAPRSGGLRSSWQASRNLGRQPGPGAEHRTVPPELLEPSEQVRRATLDCVAAGDLIEAYAERTQERRVLGRLAAGPGSGTGGRGRGVGTGAQAGEAEREGLSGPPNKTLSEAPGGLPNARPAVRRSWRLLPVVATAAGLGLLLLGQLLA